jgi:hypothetical protein
VSGVLIAGDLLLASGALTAKVPPDRIKAWALPQGTPVPSLVVTRISRVKYQFLARQNVNLVTERVQVTVRASSGAEREEILRLGGKACDDRTGTIAGFANVAVLPAGEGPDFMDDTGTVFMGSFDLRISFNEPS